MISFSCSACGKKLKVKPELAGKKVKCPHCSQAVSVPASSESLAGALTDPGTSAPGTRPRPAPGEERTLPPKPASPPEGATQALPPGASPPSLSAASPSSDTLGQAGSGAQGGLTDFLAPAQAADEIGRLGPYRVLKVLGHGGMGVVFKAEDPGLLRLVALKAMLPAIAANPTAKERFFREARAAAALKHPHIVTIFQVGEDRGAPFLAMEFLEGEPLDERIKREGKIPVAEVVRIGREVALGLACAHEKGLIHRDIKPANVWLEGKQGHAKILDFGLARALADDTHLTQSGAIIGTPAFMAPEQAGGEKVDHRADLFSLGSMMYRMCTGELPFQGNSTLAILSALAMATPAEPAKVNALVPEGLSDLIMRLLAKKPEFRPASAQEVADALAEMAGEQTAVMTRPKTVTRKAAPVPRKAATPAAGKGRRWWPAAVGAALVLAAVTVGVWWGMRPGGGQPSGPGGEQTQGGAEQAAAAWEVGPAEDVLPGLVARPAKLDGLRRWQIETVGLSSPARRLAFSPDGKLLAVGLASGAIRIYDAEALRLTRILYGHEGEVTGLSWAKDGRLASAGLDKTVRVWGPDGLPGLVLNDSDPVLAVAWRPDGTLLASGGKRSLVRLWKPDGTPEQALVGHAGEVLCLAWSPDGRLLASGSADRTVRLWDQEGKPGPVLQGPGAPVLGVHWSPDGQRLAAAGGYDNKIHLWGSDGKDHGVLEAGMEAASGVSWAPDGRKIAAGGWRGHAGQVRVWSADGKLELSSEWIGGGVAALAWAPGGRRLVYCGTEGSVRLWDADGKEGPVLARNGEVASVEFSPDGRRLASGGEDRHVRLWDADGRPGPVLAGHQSAVEGVSWRPDGKQLASAPTWLLTWEPLRLWDVESGTATVFPSGAAPIAWSPDGQLLALRKGAAIYADWLQIWDARTHRPVGPELNTRDSGWVPCAWTRDGQRLVASGNGKLRFYRRDGTAERSLDGGAGILRFSPDGRHLAVENGGAVGLRTGTGEPGKMFGGANTTDLCWAPDSQRFAAAATDGAVRMWNLDGTGRQVVGASRIPVRSLSWASQGNRLAWCGNDGAIRAYDTEGWQPLWTAVVFRSGRSAVFSPAGQMLEGHAAHADEDLVYVTQDDAGRFGLFTPAEFGQKALRGGKRLPLFGPRATTPPRPADDAWVQQVRQKPPAEQCKEVLARLEELNPGYHEPFAHKEADGKVVAVTLLPSLPPGDASRGGCPAPLAVPRDLSPLRVLTGLEQLTINGPDNGPPYPTGDLTPLAGLKLRELTCKGASVTDLKPLEGMPLEKLTLRNTLVSDLSPLSRTTSLKSLDVRGSRVADLKPVRGLLLESIGCDVEPKRDAAILKAMPTLQRINDMDARAFFGLPAMQLALEKWLQDLAPLPLEKWIETVAALPAEKQVVALDVKLAEHTPGFQHGLWNNRFEIKDGKVTGLWIETELGKGMDLAPVLALRDLRYLNCGHGASFGQITRLPPLKDTRIEFLQCGGNRPLSDLSPLQGAGLTRLECGGTSVSNLAPLKGMPLTSLDCQVTQVSDLSPLRGMKLTRLVCSRTAVKDLSPLQGMPLTQLECQQTQVADMSPLKGMPLKVLNCDFKPERDAAILREIKTLETINGKPAAEFWKEVDAKK